MAYLEISLCISKLYQWRYHDTAVSVQSSVEKRKSIIPASSPACLVFALNVQHSIAASHLCSDRPLVLAVELEVVALTADCTAQTVVAGVQILLARLVRQGGGVGQGEVERLGLLARNLKYESQLQGSPPSDGQIGIIIINHF